MEHDDVNPSEKSQQTNTINDEESGNDCCRPERPFHPLVQFDDDGHSTLSCIDIIHRVSYYLDLLNHIDVGEDEGRSDRDFGLTSDACVAYHNTIKMLYEGLRFVAESMLCNEAEVSKGQSTNKVSERLEFLTIIANNLQGLIDQTESECDTASVLLKAQPYNINDTAEDSVGYTLDQSLERLQGIKTKIHEITGYLAKEGEPTVSQEE